MAVKLQTVRFYIDNKLIQEFKTLTGIKNRKKSLEIIDQHEKRIIEQYGERPKMEFIIR